MAQQLDYQFCGPSNPLASPVLDAQRSINLYPEPGIEGSKSPLALVGTPGLHTVATAGSGPIRAMAYVEHTGELYILSGTTVYEVSPPISGGLTSLGNVPGSAGTGFAQFLFDNGGHVLVNDLAAGGIFNTASLSGSPLIQSTYMEYADGFILSSFAHTVNASALQDGTTWPALAFVTMEGFSDDVRALAYVNQNLWIIGARHSEIWYNAGNYPFPFARIQGAELQVGTVGNGQTVAKRRGGIVFVGLSRRGGPRVYASSGMSVTPISTPAIEAIIQTATQFTGGAATGFCYEESGHEFYELSLSTVQFPGYSSSAVGWTGVYDFTTGLWHERGSLNGSNIGARRVSCFSAAETASGVNLNYAGDSSNGKIYQQSFLYPDEAGAAIKRVRVGGAFPTKNRWANYPDIEMDCDIGTASMTVDYSDNGGRTFGNSRNISASGASAVDTFARFFGLQWGRSRDRRFRLTIQDSANLIRLANMYVQSDLGIQGQA